MKIDAGIEMLEIPAEIGGTQTLIYPTLIWSDSTTILVDAGFPGQVPEFRRSITKAGAFFDKIDKIIITHHDRDHIGSLRAILSELSHKALVLVHEEEKAYIEGSIPPFKATLADALDSPYPPEMKATFLPQKFDYLDYAVTVDKVVQDGETLPFCGGIEVIHVPGHTLGHICLYIRQSKTLVAGDAFSAEGGKLGIVPKLASLDWGLALKSLDKLFSYDVEKVICYHGGLWKGDKSRFIAEVKGLQRLIEA